MRLITDPFIGSINSCEMKDCVAILQSWDLCDFRSLLVSSVLLIQSYENSLKPFARATVMTPALRQVPRAFIGSGWINVKKMSSFTSLGIVTSFQNMKLCTIVFLVCNHVTRPLCLWSIQWFFSRRRYMKIQFSGEKCYFSRPPTWT